MPLKVSILRSANYSYLMHSSEARISARHPFSMVLNLWKSTRGKIKREKMSYTPFPAILPIALIIYSENQSRVGSGIFIQNIVTITVDGIMNEND